MDARPVRGGSSACRPHRRGTGRPRLACALLLIVSVLAAAPFAVAADTWARTLGGAGGGESVLEVLEAADGSYLLAGTTDSFGTNTADLWLMRLDADGAVLSERVYGNTALSGTEGVALAPDGSAVFSGRSVIDIFTIHHAHVVKLDATGTVAWSRNFATPLPATGRHFLVDDAFTGDGGVIASGSTSVNDGSPLSAWVVKLDADGLLQWHQIYGAGGEDAKSVVQTSDGGYAVAGWTTSTGTGMTDVWIMKLDAAGAIEWQWVMGGPDQEEATSLVQLGDGGYALSGWTNSFTASGHAGWVLRLDASGALLWNRVTGDAEWSDLQDVRETSDGQLLLTGRIGEPGFPSNDLWLIKMRADDGTVLWQRAYEGDQGDWGSVATLLGDGGFLVGGTWAWGFPGEDLWLLRLDEAGGIPGCGLIRDTSVVVHGPRIFANPGVATAGAPDSVMGAITVGDADTRSTVAVQCEGVSCAALRCDAVTVDPDPAVCRGVLQVFTAQTTGGEVPLSFAWDLDGDTLPDDTGNPLAGVFPAGDWTMTALVTDSCTSPAPQTCSVSVPVTVHASPTPVVVPSGPTSFCAARGESVTLDAGAGFSAYQWTLDGADIPGADAQDYEVTESGDFVVWVTGANGCLGISAPVTVDAEDCPCEPLTCDEIIVDPDPVCEGTEQTLTAQATGGEGVLVFLWDLDGDTVDDEQGNPVQAILPVGVPIVQVTVIDSCVDPAVQSCSLWEVATVFSAIPPPEISDVRAGAPPLLVRRDAARLVMEVVPEAVAYNVHADLLGSWYFPRAATGSVCGIDTWTDNGDGTLTVDYDIPAGTWIVVTASTSCAEGPAGTDSEGTERMGQGVWELCGPAP